MVLLLYCFDTLHVCSMRLYHLAALRRCVADLFIPLRAARGKDL